MNFETHDAAGHLTVLGWTTLALYMVAALLSFRTAMGLVRSQASAATNQWPIIRGQWSSRMGRTWISLGVILAVLGLNKLLNLQTALIELGRHFAGRENLQAHRNELHVLFFLGSMLSISTLFAVALFRLRAHVGRLARQLPLAATGCAMIGVYIVIRAASITGVDRILGFNLDQIPFLWALETGGVLLVIVQAVRKWS